jgi:tRNA A-37 threonylcarbamoyl transferase component Bud32
VEIPAALICRPEARPAQTLIIRSSPEAPVRFVRVGGSRERTAHIMLYLKVDRPVTPIRFADGRLRGKVVSEHNTPGLRALLGDPVAFMHAPDVRVLKDNPRSRVVIGRLDGRDVVVKESHAKNGLKALKRAFIPSRAARGWHAALMVEALGVPTANPIAYIDQRHGLLRGRSWLVLERVPGVDFVTWMTAEPREPDERERMIRSIANIYARLHRARVTHSDNRPGNFLIHDGQPVLIDLDVTVRHPWWSPSYRHYMRNDVRTLLGHFAGCPALAEEFRRVFRDYGLDGV